MVVMTFVAADFLSLAPGVVMLTVGDDAWVSLWLLTEDWVWFLGCVLLSLTSQFLQDFSTQIALVERDLKFLSLAPGVVMLTVGDDAWVSLWLLTEDWVWFLGCVLLSLTSQFLQDFSTQIALVERDLKFAHLDFCRDSS